MNDKKVIAVDFDGTLCEFAFPEIGIQTYEQQLLMKQMIRLRELGHKIILWTNRGDNDEYKSLSGAVQWCKDKGLEFDAVNTNLITQKKLSGYSPKIMADIYIDDKDYRFHSNEDNSGVLQMLEDLK